MVEYKLSYTAKEIDEKLGKVDSLVSTVNGVAPDTDGNVQIEVGGAGGIIDVFELPTENINEQVFYRLLTGILVFNQYDGRENNYHCVCVNELPEVGKAVTTDMTDLLVYYNVADGDAYGYITAELGAVAGVPAGWYTLDVLAPVFDVTYMGVITDINDDPCDDSFRLLLTKDYYIYQDGWCKLPFACEKAPAFDIQWDGEIGDRIALDMSMLGYDQGTYFVKVSDDVFTTDELVGCTLTVSYNDGSSSDERTIDEYDFDTTTYAGAFTINNCIVVLHDADALAAALGIPAGIYPNGVYFLLDNNLYVSRLVAPSRITKIDEKFLPDMGVDGLAQVAYSGNYNDLYNRPNLNNYVTTSEVDTKIAEAIGSAIGGSY